MKIPRVVWILSIISLLTDMASEMLYPVMPLYLKSIGFSVAFIGVLEGLAEAVAGLSKGYFGKWSDVSGRRVPFVQLGYALSALSKPMMALMVHPAWIFSARSLDRLGKGLRTGARDALLSAEATPATKGAIFGFHRSMDTLGAVFGPAVALWFLYRYPGAYSALFYGAFLPGFAAIWASLLLTQKEDGQMAGVRRSVSFWQFGAYWKQSPVAYQKLVMGLLAFALINSSDVFLLLKVRELGFSDTAVVGVYIFYNLVYAALAFRMGMLGDRIGLKTVFILGLLVFSVVYGGMALMRNAYLVMALFLLYGVYAAATEGVAKAWITNVVAPEDTATAIGTFAGLQSICALMASSLTGLVWYVWGGSVAFAFTAGFTLVIAGYMGIVVPKPASMNG